jgi:hypothetical protein
MELPKTSWGEARLGGSGLRQNREDWSLQAREGGGILAKVTVLELTSFRFSSGYTPTSHALDLRANGVHWAGMGKSVPS